MAKKRKREKVINRSAANQPAVDRGQLKGRSLFLWSLLGLTVVFTGLVLLAYSGLLNSNPSPRRVRQRAAPLVSASPPRDVPKDDEQRETRYFSRGNLTMVWDRMQSDIQAQVRPTSVISNIAPQDYAGPEACVACHQENHAAWSQHPHRWMNALANTDTVKGDFSGTAEIHYHGGVGRFYRAGESFRMSFDREGVHREYEITQTIGSRFYQYYVGKGIVGPEAEDHEYYHIDFVLPFGVWLERQAWVPIVHVAEELPEEERWESALLLKPPKSQQHGIEGVGLSRGEFDDSFDLALTYANSCNFCHTTFPLGEMFVRNPKLIGPSLANLALFNLSSYVAETHPELWTGSQPPEQLPSPALDEMTHTFINFDAREKAATLGVSCEACHLGCAHHSQHADEKPAFMPHGPHVLTFDDPQQLLLGRTPANVNAVCARCHVGNRPTYAAGMATWNSTEYTDALKGACYSQLTCVGCHDPHAATGLTWPKSPDEDDASCLACHAEFDEPILRQRHTHHSAGSPGDRCMNCHMPKINEGLQDVVRTHTIFSPTQPDMLESNQPNACNLCHLDRSINWTTHHLMAWYGRTYDSNRIDGSYRDRSEPVGMGWLKQAHAPTRLVATEALAAHQATWALPQLINGLDDAYLLNRQFTQKSVERLTSRRLDTDFGYWFYLTPTERAPIMARIRAELLPH